MKKSTRQQGMMKKTLRRISICLILIIFTTNLSAKATEDKGVGIRSKTYDITEEYISKIKGKTTVKLFKENVETEQEMVFKNKKGTALKETALVATESTLTVGSKTYTLIVRGDVDGNGSVTATDLAKLKLYITGKTQLTEAQKRAGDIDGNGEINDVDVKKLNDLILGIDIDDVYEIENVKTYKEETESNIFSKDENIIIRFKNSDTRYQPNKAKINGKEYDITQKEDTLYEVVIEGLSDTGKKTLKIEEITLNNGSNKTIDKTLEIEIIKETPTITDFVAEEQANNEIKVTFTLNDNDNSITDGTIVILDDNQNEVKTQKLATNNNNLSFQTTDSEIYTAKVIADYSISTTSNETAQVILDEEIDFTNRMIEMKDILDIFVYKKNGESVTELSSIVINDLEDKDQFLVRVQMKDLPEFYAPIKSYSVQNGELVLELEYEKATQYKDGVKQNKLEVVYGSVTDGEAFNQSFSSLISRIRKNPSANITLTRDYDAADYAGDTRSIIGAGYIFKGTFNGNGHTIRNLKKPLFDELSKATVKNVIFDNAYISNTESICGKGILANKAIDSTITNVHVKDASLSTYYMNNGYGGIIGEIRGCNVNKCSVTNIKIFGPSGQNTYNDRIGGICGYMSYSTIEDCYVTGSLSGKYVGGITGFLEKYVDDTSIIKHCITKATLYASNGPNESGGIVGYVRKSNQVKLTQNISLSGGSKAHKVHGSAVTLDSNGFNVEMNESTLTADSGSSGGRIKSIAKEEFTGDICKELSFNESTWNLANINYDNLPSLNNSDPNNTSEQEEDKNSDVYIPDYEIIKEMPDFDSNKQILYANLYKLMPFFDSKYLVIDGTKISSDNILNQKLIKTVLAYDENHKLKTSLAEEDYNTLSTARVIFKDNTTQEYTLKYKNMYGNVASYEIDELGTEYTFDRYIIKTSAPIVDELITYMTGLEYTKNLQGLVSLDLGHRQYGEYFNNTLRTKENATKFIINYLSNTPGNVVTLDSDIVSTMVKSRIINNNSFRQTLFAYTYYSRFYDMDMSGANLTDVLLFRPDIYREKMKFNDIITEFLNSKWKQSNVSYHFYKENLGSRLGIPVIANFIDYNINILTDYEDNNDWFTDYFSTKCPLVEAPAQGYEDTVDYRAWTQLKKQEKFILPVITLPKDSGYMVSAPTTFLIGSQRVYCTDPNSASQKAAMINKMKSHGAQMAKFYATSVGFVGSQYLNRVCDVQIDTKYLPVLGMQAMHTTEEPFTKNLNDLMYEWSTIAGVAAYAGSERVYWCAYSGLTAYQSTWTHETGHNQCNVVFFKRNGFRPVGGGNNGIDGAEDYTDGNTQQGFGDGAVNFNLSYEYAKDALITTNLTTERINTTEKINSYYKGMFEAIDFLDYAEAKAFLRLTPEEQSKVAIQVYYPNEADKSTVGWRVLTKEAFEEMNLQTIEDIYDNHITIRPGVTGDTSQGTGKYGSEGMYVRRWYQPHNDKGRTHSHGFTYTAWQMLGMAGYDNGYITYFSGKSHDDLDAIRKVTGDSNMTWRQFKLDRYNEMQESWDTIPYINANDLVENYVEALKADAANNDRNVTRSTNVRRVNYHYLKRVTDDFRAEVLNDENIEIIPIRTANEFKEKLTENPCGYYVLANDIDLSSVSEENAIINGYFMGKLDGQGHKLTGNTVPVFNCLKFAKVSNLTIENSTINSTATDIGALTKLAQYSEINNVIGKNINITTNNKNVGALIGSMAYTLVKNTHVTESTISGASRAGLITGYAGACQILECSTTGNVVATGNACGGFIGEIYSSTNVKNCYSVGEVTGNQDIGGFIGYVNASSIEKCFSSTKATGKAGTASFVGQTTNNSIIADNITLVNQVVGYKFDGRTAANSFTNFKGNYEYKENAGASTLTRTGIDFTEKITVVEEKDLKRGGFYTKTLGWDKTIWNFSKALTDGLPRLRNSDPNVFENVVEKYTITTAEEFESLLNEHKDATFIIDADIDLSSLNTNSTIVSGEFMGRIEGNNHTLSGNTVPIFNNLKYANIYNLNIEGSNVTRTEKDMGALSKQANYAELKNIVARNINVATGEDAGGLVGVITYSDVQNVHIVESTVSGTKRVGGLVGYVGNTTFRECSSNVNVTSSGDSCGGFVGEAILSTKIENSYSLGQIKGNNYVGGFAGIVNASSITNCFSTAKTDGNTAISGFIGKSLGNATIKNNIVLGNQIGNKNRKYKFDGATEAEQFALEGYSGNYEYEDNLGISTLTREGIDFTGKISIASQENITSEEFYINTLGWNPEVWDLTNVVNEYIPKLKNLDPNDIKETIAPKNISILTADEFIEKIKARPYGEYTIAADLDFSDKTYGLGSVIIPGEFYGKIYGNNHTISNLTNATLFDEFHGEVDNLNIYNFEHGNIVRYNPPNDMYVWDSKCNKTKSNVAVFARKTIDSNFRNINIDKALIFGFNNIATMVSVDENSTFENINITRAWVYAGNNSTGGNKSAVFIGEKTGGSIKNCYIQGELDIEEGIESGGIIGTCHGDTVIEKVVSNVYARSMNVNKAKQNGLFIGKIDGNADIKDSVVIGSTSRTNASKQIHKFTASSASIASTIQNCYENGSSNGASDSNNENIKTVTQDELLTKEFYINTLHFDETIWNLDDIKEEVIDTSYRYGSDITSFPVIIKFGFKK